MRLIAPFEVDGRRYVYEATSNKIYQVGEGIFELLNTNGYHQKISDAFDKSPVREFHFYLDRKEIEERLKSGLGGLSLEVTEDCNLRCSYCINSGIYSGVRVRSSRKMEWDIAKKAVDFFLARRGSFEDKMPVVGFYGGEPLLNFSLVKKAILYVRDKAGDEIGFTLTTNGTLLDEEKMVFLRDNRVLLLISLDGDREINDRYRRYPGGGGTFDDVMGNLIKLRELDPGYFKNHVRFSVVAHPPVNLVDLDRFFSSLGIGVVFSMVEVFGNKFLQNKPVKLDGMKPLAEKFKKLCLDDVYNKDLNHPGARFARVLFSNTLRAIHNRQLIDVSGERFPYGSFCVPGATKCFVSSSGEYFPCEKVSGIERLKIGDVRSGFDLEKIIDILKEVTRIRNRVCSSCWAFRLCRACFYHFYGPSGFDRDRMSYFCDGIRKETKSSLRLYCSILEENERALDFLVPS